MYTVVDMLKKMVEKKASDLHLVAGLHPAFRIHGDLLPDETFEKPDGNKTREMIYALLTEEQIKQFETSPESRYELDFAYSLPGVGRFRMNVHKQRGTVTLSARALADRIPKLEELGLPAAVRDLVKAKKGLILVTGPTGSGKSTTLAALIDAINSTRCDHILTAEDPIEYLHNYKKSYVTQREIGPFGDTLTFENALKYALRQDPDVILIGEMRDYETIGIALTSAETGHLVFGTLHTSSAAQTVSRIVDVFPVDQQPQVRTMLASNLVAVISQVLLPRKDKAGRVLACEVLLANAAVKNNIRSGKVETIYQTIQMSQGEGMQTLDQSLLKLYRQGLIDYETAKPFIQDRSTHDQFRSYNSR